MSSLHEHEEVVFFQSILFNHKFISEPDVLEIINKHFGDCAIFRNDYFPMKNYYEKEMGAELNRLFVFFHRKRCPDELIELKLLCDELEKTYSQDNNRIFNFDPGYISKSNVVLATGKPYNHRIYLGGGVYGELTYTFKAQSFETLPWTYPDYSHLEIIKVFNIYRELNFFENSIASN